VIKSFDWLLREQFGVNADGTPVLTGDMIVQDLAKNLATGLPGAPTGSGSLQPLQLLNLDSTMSSVLFRAPHLKLFQFIARVPSVNAYYEWTRRDRYGSLRGGFGFREGGAPRGSTSAYTRQGAYVKYMGVRGGVTHQALVPGQLGGYMLDPVEEEHFNRTMELLGKIERWVFFGDDGITDSSGVQVHYSGILNQVAGAYVTRGQATTSKQIVDLRGRPFKFEYFNEVAYKLYQDGKLLDFSGVRCFMNPFILNDLSNQRLNMERKLLGANNPDYVPGVPLAGFDTNFGRFNFEASIFLQGVDGDAPPTAADPGAPTDASAPTATLQANGGGDFGSTPPACCYTITAFNDAGESVGVRSDVVTPAAASDAVNVSWTASPDSSVWGYRVYRGTKADGSDHRWIATLPRTATSYVDQNQNIPGTGYVAFLERSAENLVIAQMTPLVKFPLAVVSTTMEFLLLLYHTLVVKIPERMVIYRNVGLTQTP